MLTTEEFNAILPAVPVRIQRSRQHKQVSPNGSQINPVKDMKEQILKVAQDLEKGTIDSNKAQSLLLGLFGVSGSCSCGVKYVKTKKSDIPYDTDDNVYYTDIMIYHCPKCGNIDRIDEY